MKRLHCVSSLFRCARHLLNKSAPILQPIVTALWLSTTVSAITVVSTDVPKAIPDLGSATSVLSGPNLILTDLNLVLNEVRHTSVPDLHGQLTSPAGTTVTFLYSFPENGLLAGLGTPDNFINTALDDQAATNLSLGTAPYTGSFNVNDSTIGHPLVSNPFATFNGQNSLGTWTLFLRDDAGADSGNLVSWSIQFTGVPEPSCFMSAGFGFIGLVCHARISRQSRGKTGRWPNPLLET